MYKNVNDLPQEYKDYYNDLNSQINKLAYSPETVTNYKKSLHLLFVLAKFSNYFFPNSKHHTKQEVYRLQILNTFFKDIEDSDELIEDLPCFSEYKKLLKLLKDAKTYGQEVHF